MTDLRQAAQQALDALAGELWLMLDKPEDEQYRVRYAYLLTVITALRTALAAQPEQQAEPVAYYHPRNNFYWAKPTKIIAPTIVDVPPIPLYTTPPQREWVGLTDDDWEKVANRKNTVLDTFEQGAVWAAYKLERRNT